MVMACSPHIKPCFNRPEQKSPVRSGQILTESGKIGVAGRIARRGIGINVITFAVGMPKLNERPAYRLAVAVENTALEVGDNARRGGQVIIELYQVIVFV